MRLVFVLFVLGLAIVAGCGYQIGASCIVSTDCSADGTRICDIAQPGGYCTIMGCDYDTCPSDSECVRFYSGSFSNQPCNYVTENVSTDDCTEDELCSLAGQCVPRSAEIRWCMSTCNSDGDCRDGYECRGLAKMITDGGEVVLAPGDKDTSSTQGFCAPSPTTTTSTD